MPVEQQLARDRFPVETAWDHFPRAEDWTDLMINPVTLRDQHGHLYGAFPWPTGRRTPAICTACEKDFAEDGWIGFALDGGKFVRIIVCAEHQNHTAYHEEEPHEGVPG